jgi:transcriptional regulator with XRE-family HTH domain
MTTNETDELHDVSTEKKVFRERLIARMKEQKLTASELANKAGMSKDAISTYTTMRSLPTPKTLERLAKVLKCKPQDLLPDRPQLDTILELRDHAEPGYRLLVIKMPVPMKLALETYERLYVEQQKVERLLKKSAASGAREE